MRKRNFKIVCGLGIAFTVFILSLFLHHGKALNSLNQYFTHWLYEDKKDISEAIVVVAIDDRSLQDTAMGGLGSMGTWPWTYYGKAIDRIEAGGARSLLLDLFFSKSGSAVKKSTLVTLLTENKNLSEFGEAVLPYLGEDNPDELAFSQTLEKYDNIFGLKKIGGDYELVNGQFSYSKVVEPYPLIGDKMHLGFYNLNLNPDSSNTSLIYGLPLKESAAGKIGEHVDLMIAQDYLEEDALFDTVPIENGQMLIHYTQKPGDWQTVSFLDVYQGTVDTSIFKNKIVLLGVSSLTGHDFYYTPIAPETPMPGIEIHANAIQTLLDGNYLRYQDFFGFAALLAVMILVALLAMLSWPMLWAGIFLCLELLSFLALTHWYFERGIILDFIWPVSAVFVTSMAILIYRNFTEFAEKRKLKEAFSHYVAPEIVQEITEHPELLALGGERREITAFFLDIENFTHLSEGMQPQEVVKVINRYFDALSKVIMQFGGSVDKFEGDAIMALFGAPIPSKDHALKACLSAIAIQEKMAELNAASGLQLNVRIGLATGEAIVGNMGSQERFDYTAMGDTVNTASRLESANKFYKTRILATESTATAAHAMVAFREIDRVQLKGKDQVLKVFEILGTTESVSDAKKTFLNLWVEALEFYRTARWGEAEEKMKTILEKVPGDGPAATFLARIALLRVNAPKDWDGVWRFESK